MPSLLEIKGLTKLFGGLTAVSQFDMHVNQGEIIGLIDPNGAGKKTDIVKQGISLIPEGRQLFPYSSVLGNLKLGGSVRKDKNGINNSLEEVYKLFPRLQERRN